MRLVAVLALAMLLVGCAGGTTAPAPAPAAAPKAAEQPAQAAPKPAVEAKLAAQQPAAAPKPAAETKPAAEAKPATQQPAAAKPAAAAPSRLTMGTSAATSSYYAYTVALAKLLQTKVPGLNVTVSEGGGASMNAKRIAEDKIDFSLTSFTALYPFYSGLDPTWKDNPLKDARSLWVFDPGAHVWWVREDSGVTSVEQLHGKDYNAGGRGSGTEYIARQLVFPALGIEPKWYTGGYDDALAAAKDRRIVGMGKATAVKRPDALIQEALTAMKIRILSWTPEQVQKVKTKHAFIAAVDIPVGTYKAAWNEKPITTWGDGIGMYTRAKFPADLAYAFTKAAIEDTKAGGEGIQAAAYGGMQGVDLVQATMDLSGNVPLHAGAYKYYQEIGAKVPDVLKSPEAR